VKKIILFLIVFTTVILTYRLFSFINKYAVNLLYDDQWWIADMIIENKPFKELFFYLYSEHRIGVGLIIMRTLAVLTYWNTRFENFGFGISVIIIALFSLALKYKLAKKFEVTDIAIPIIIINLHHHENLLEGFRVMYLIPVIIMYIYFWLFNLKFGWKYIAILILVILSTFSGFHGIFLNLFVFLFEILKFIKAKNLKSKIANVIVLITVILITSSYFIGFSSDHSDFTIPTLYYFYETPTRMINQIFGTTLRFPFNLISPLIILGALIIFITQFIKKRNLNLFPIFCLYFYSILFIITIIFGRNKFGPEVASSSRYVSHIVFLYLASYLTLILFLNKKLKKILFITIGIPILYFILFNNKSSYEVGNYYKNNKNAWIKCYLKKKNVHDCNDFFIFDKKHSNYLQTKVDQLEKKKWSFFAEIQ